eukprot:gene4037-biopygen6700
MFKKVALADDSRSCGDHNRDHACDNDRDGQSSFGCDHDDVDDDDDDDDDDGGGGDGDGDDGYCELFHSNFHFAAKETVYLGDAP